MYEKKKKGKKKKGNQSKHSASIFTAEDANQTKPDDSVQNHHSGAPSNADSQSVGVSESDLDQEKLKIHEAKCGFLEERIKLLQNEVDSCIKKEASLEEKLDDLQCKHASLTMREAHLEERVKKMEEMHQSFALEKSSIKEAVFKLGDANERLHLQVMELADSRDSLAQQNKQFTDSISTLDSRIHHLEMVASFYASSKIQGEEKPHLQAAEASTKPYILNEDPSEKASAMHEEPVELAENPTSEKTNNHSATMKSSTSADYASEYHKSIVESNEKIETTAKANESCSPHGIEDLSSMEQLQQIQLLGLDDSIVSEDVISVPLDDIIQELQTTPEKLEAEPVVPLSDAPLIGAPFRLISFVARFVSGSDLVDQNKPKRDF